MVKVHAVGSLEGRPCIVFQLVEGRTLSELGPSLSLEQRVELVRQAGLGLHAAHLQGLVHRDVKPANVLVEQSRDAGPVALLTDFGLARGEEAGASRSGLPAGTLDYMSPEQLLAPGPPDFRSDVYALGATLYSVLAGRPPFRGPSSAGTPQDRGRARRGPAPPHPRGRPGTADPRGAGAPPGPRDHRRACDGEGADGPLPQRRGARRRSRRVQRGEPIHARPVALLERALKWSRRQHRARARRGGRRPHPPPRGRLGPGGTSAGPIAPRWRPPGSARWARRWRPSCAWSTSGRHTIPPAGTGPHPPGGRAAASARRQWRRSNEFHSRQGAAADRRRGGSARGVRARLERRLPDSTPRRGARCRARRAVPSALRTRPRDAGPGGPGAGVRHASCEARGAGEGLPPHG